MFGNELIVTEPGLRGRYIRLAGAGAGNAPTIVYGQAITIARIADGDYTVTWKENPGTWAGMEMPGIDALAAGIAAIKNYDIAFAYTAASFTLELQIYTGAGSLVVLAANQWLNLMPLFKDTKA